MNKILLGVIVLLVILAGIIWFYQSPKETQENSLPVLSVSAFNQTQSNDATKVSARPQDSIEFILTGQNQTDQIILGYVMTIDIFKLSDSATLIDAGGASYNSASNSLVWTPLDIPVGGSIEKKFTVRVNELPPNTPSQIMEVEFSNKIQITVSPKLQVLGNTVPASSQDPYTAPITGSTTGLVLILSVLTTFAGLIIRKIWFRAWG
ncbi:MAG: hypothetical protein A3B10_00715 [Candidatus Doudnabacteria bacterium RIFCSPLOWO2_01_FULL_44_21]|uniref:DUF11 domain-containing protein n=1 Tax=Candidatus Doudnabacteria bacterium RIFCSPLOWO2_01_FULL_44_21 TaxID=1817841 RepID=A0A1F5PYK1_9BACT|nr:MAG: hypothetical protein A3B95_00575 [Candidatus Doudnabacteria bacterium RIFCSPHIGHO2_02_FULL_43_13b]OGE94660.1 MAG: hypothetical protein A3B10_00715 [Candidatus Doudnabacteria bacterium RIFCSPLOWO2_01_FULL_44_21]